MAGTNMLVLAHELLEDNEVCTEFLDILIKEYAKKSIGNSEHLIGLITKITSIMLEKKDEDLLKQKMALECALFIKPVAKDKAVLASYLMICEARYPLGEVFSSCGEVEVNLFNELLDLLRNKKIFNYNNEDNVAWAKAFNHWDYLLLVKEKHPNLI